MYPLTTRTLWLGDVASVCLASAHPEILDGVCTHPLLRIFIPSVSFNTGTAGAKATYTLILNDDKHKQSIERHAETITIWDAFKTNGVQGYVLYFIYKMLDAQLISKNLLAFHASSVSVENSAVLFIGSSGSGKSTLATHLAQTEEGMGFMSNNRTVIDANTNPCSLKYGSKDISLRNQSRQLLLPSTSSLPPSLYPTNYYRYEELGVTLDERTLPLRHVMQVNISDGVEECFLLDAETAAFYLYDNASKISLGDCLMFGGKTVAPSLESHGDDQKRLNAVRRVIEGAGIYYLKGSLNFLKEKVLEIVNSAQA